MLIIHVNGTHNKFRQVIRLYSNPFNSALQHMSSRRSNSKCPQHLASERDTSPNYRDVNTYKHLRKSLTHPLSKTHSTTSKGRLHVVLRLHKLSRRFQAWSFCHALYVMFRLPKNFQAKLQSQQRIISQRCYVIRIECSAAYWWHDNPKQAPSIEADKTSCGARSCQ